MLQFYDKIVSTALLALAAAGGGMFAAVAQDAPACDPSDGYGISLTKYVAEASSCVAQSEAFRTDFADELLTRTNRVREQAGLAPLTRRASLDQAARAHALDMAARNYASHTDLEGRDHLYRIRAFDRSMLVGATGANVLIAGTGADAGDIFVLMQEDELNDANLMRAGFTDIGIAVAKTDGQAYVVQVFASQEGELKEALPLTLSGTTPIRARLAGTGRETVGWGLTDQASGELLAKGNGTRVRASRLGDTLGAALDIVVNASHETQVLKGPLVSAQ
jgi:uncharacterized protein YkwD